MRHDEPTRSNLESRNSARISDQKAGPSGSSRPFSTRSLVRWTGSEASNEAESWATESMKGHLLLVRNSTVLAANVIAQRQLDARIYDLSRERYERLRSNDRGRELFIRRLRMKGGRFCEMASNVEAKRKSRSRMNISELNRIQIKSNPCQEGCWRKGVGEDSLVMGSPPFLTTDGDKTQEDSAEKEEEEEEEIEEKETLTDDEEISSMSVHIRSYGSQSAHRYNSHHLHNRAVLRSFSALPVTRGRYKDNFPIKCPSIRSNGIFLPTSTTPQPPLKLQPGEFGFDSHAERSKSCVFSDVCQRSLMSEIPECVHVAKIIDDIDSLHVSPRIKKKVRPKSDAVLRDIFRL